MSEARDEFARYDSERVVPAVERCVVALDEWTKAGIEAAETHANGEDA